MRACDIGRREERSIREVFTALASDNRLAIVEALLASERSEPGSGLSISGVASITELSRFSASRHLGILRNAGVVVAEPAGMSMRHRVATAALEQIEDWLYSRTSQLSD